MVDSSWFSLVECESCHKDGWFTPLCPDCKTVDILVPVKEKEEKNVKQWTGLEKPKLKRSNYYSVSWRYIVDPTFTDSQLKNLDTWHEMQWRLDRGEDVVDFLKEKSSFISLKDVAKKAVKTKKKKKSVWQRLKQLEDSAKVNIQRIASLETQVEGLLSESSFIITNGGQV